MIMFPTIPRYFAWTPQDTTLPQLYWNVYSNEQRIHAICRELGKVIRYADMMGVEVSNIAKAINDIQEGKLDEFIVTAIAQWFEENQPEIMQDIADINAIIGDGFTSENTITAAVEAINTLIGDGFTSENTITAAVESINDDLQDLDNELQTLENTVTADSWVTTPRVADSAITVEKLSDNLINGLYIEPQLIGDYTAFSGKFVTSNASADNPYRPQGFCYTTNGELMQMLINNAESSMRIVNMSEPNNTYTIQTTNRAGFGHANQVEYVPSLDRYYISDGLGRIIVCDATFTVITRVTIPNDEQWAVFMYDRATGKAYVADYYSNLYDFDLTTNTLTQSAVTFETPIQTGDVVVQGAACYDNVAVFPIAKRPQGLKCYSLVSGKYIGTITVNANGDEVYPISEIEDVSFDNEGNMYFASAMNVNDQGYCFASSVWKCNIFTGMPVTVWWSGSSEKHVAYVEAVNYTGFYSDGSSQYPFKSIETVCIHAAHASNRIKSIFLGTNSVHSTTTEQHWFGFFYLSGVNASIRTNGSNNIIIHGSFELRDGCTIFFLNRLHLASCYNTPKNFLMRVDNSMFVGQTVEFTAGYNDAGITRGILLQYTIAVWINAIVNALSFTNVAVNQVHGFGYVIDNPKNGTF